MAYPIQPPFPQAPSGFHAFPQAPPGFGPHQPSPYIPPQQITDIARQPPGYLPQPYNYVPPIQPSGWGPPPIQPRGWGPPPNLPQPQMPQIEPIGPWTDHTIQPSLTEFPTYVEKENGRFLMEIDMQIFEPYDYDVLVSVENGFLVVDARYNEIRDSMGYVSRNFCRRYNMTDDIERETIRFYVTRGMLKIRAYLKPPPLKPDAREVPCILTQSVLD